MAFLELNGITVPVTNASARRRVERKGRRDRSFRGALRDSRRGLRRQWDLELCFPDHEEGEAFVRLFQGDGHFFDLAEGLEGSTWLHPAGGANGLQFHPNVWGARGRGVGAAKGALSGPTTPDGFFRVDAQLPDDEWTILWAEKQTDNGNIDSLNWDFFAKRSDGVGYFSGAREDRVGEPGVGWTLASVEVRAGELTLRNDFSVDFGIDDVLILPWKAPESWLEAWTTITPMAPKLPAMPVLTMRGDLLEEEFAYAVGDVQGIDFVQRAKVAGIGWVNNAMRIKARLSQVDPAFFCVEERLEDTVRLPGTLRPSYWFTTSDIDDKANASLEEGDSVSAWFQHGSIGVGSAQTIDAAVPVYRERGTFPFFRAPVVQWDNAAIARLQTVLPATLVQPNTILCIYRTTDELDVVGTQYLVDGASSQRHIIRSGPQASQQAYAGSFLGTGNDVVGNERGWNVGIFHANGGSSQYRWNGNDTFGAGGSLGMQGVTLGGLYNSTSSNADQSDLVELAVWNDSPGVGGVPTIAELEQYVIDRYLEGG